MLPLNLALAIVPALLVLRWAYRRDAAKREPPGLVLGAFGLGILAIVVAIGIGLALAPLERLFGGVWSLVYEAYFVAGTLEEVAKLAVVLLFIARRKEFDEVADGMVYVMAASLGFAAIENALYLGEPPLVLILRGVTAVPLHGAAGGLMGYFVGRSVVEGRGSWGPGLLAAIALHGTYDFFLFVGGILTWATIPLLVIGVALTARLFRVAVEKDRAAGRVPRAEPGPPPDQSGSRLR